ncbi:hypothetical protein [Streptomyces sp. NPDC054786]
MEAECADVLGQARCAPPSFVLRFEALDAVCLYEFGFRLLLRGFPAQPCLPCFFQVRESRSFGGFSTEVYLLRDLGELLLKEPFAGVGSLTGLVMQPAADADSQTVGGGVVVARDPGPGVLFGIGEFLRRGGVIRPVLFLEDEEIAFLPLGSDREVGRSVSSAMRRRRTVRCADRAGVTRLLRCSEQGVDEMESSVLNGLGQPHGLGKAGLPPPRRIPCRPMREGAAGRAFRWW